MTTPAGWYHGEGDPPGTQRYWNGTEWVGPAVETPPPPPGQGYPTPPVYQGPAITGNPLARLFSFRGRVNRSTYAIVAVVAFGILIALASIDIATGSEFEGLGYGPYAVIGQLAMLWPGAATAARRLHDFGATGWWALAWIVPFGSFILLLILLFRPGHAVPNQHGNVPERGFTL